MSPHSFVSSVQVAICTAIQVGELIFCCVSFGFVAHQSPQLPRQFNYSVSLEVLMHNDGVRESFQVSMGSFFTTAVGLVLVKRVGLQDSLVYYESSQFWCFRIRALCTATPTLPWSGWMAFFLFVGC